MTPSGSEGTELGEFRSAFFCMCGIQIELGTCEIGSIYIRPRT